jgi:hypothetical protein
MPTQYEHIEQCHEKSVCKFASGFCLGLGTEFRSEKIPRNRVGTISVIPRKEAFIPRHSEFNGRASSEARNGAERNGTPRKKLVLRNSSKLTLFVHQKSSFLTLFLKYSAAAFCSELVSFPRNRSERNSKNMLLFCSTERNSELCSHPQKGSEQNYESAYHTYDYPTGPLFRGTTGIPSEITICSCIPSSAELFFSVGNSQPYVLLNAHLLAPLLYVMS